MKLRIMTFPLIESNVLYASLWEVFSEISVETNTKEANKQTNKKHISRNFDCLFHRDPASEQCLKRLQLQPEYVFSKETSRCCGEKREGDGRRKRKRGEKRENPKVLDRKQCLLQELKGTAQLTSAGELIQHYTNLTWKNLKIEVVEAEAVGSEVPSHPQVHSEFQVSKLYTQMGFPS